MAVSYTIPFTNGSHSVTSSDNSPMYHQLCFAGNDTISGNLKVQVRGAGSKVFEEVPDATSLDLSSPKSLLFTFSVAEYKFTINNKGGASSQLHITDSLPVTKGG